MRMIKSAIYRLVLAVVVTGAVFSYGEEEPAKKLHERIWDRFFGGDGGEAEGQDKERAADRDNEEASGPVMPEDPYGDFEELKNFCDALAGDLAEAVAGLNKGGKRNSLDNLVAGLNNLSSELDKGPDNEKGVKLAGWTVKLRIDTLWKFGRAGYGRGMNRKLDWLHTTLDNWPGLAKVSPELKEKKDRVVPVYVVRPPADGGALEETVPAPEPSVLIVPGK